MPGQGQRPQGKARPAEEQPAHDGAELELPVEEDDDEPRKRRSDADQPRMWARDIYAFKWMGEQGAASADDLRVILGRFAAGPTKQRGLLSKTRVRHIIEERWLPAKMIYADTMLGKKWVWPTRRALQRAGLPFSPHRPADINLYHLQQCNRIRIYLEDSDGGKNLLLGGWESERMIELAKKDWRAKRKADPSIYIPDEYDTWHMPDAIWRWRNEDDAEDSLRTTFIEVETSPKRPEKLDEILLNLAQHGTTWYFVDMDPRRGVFKALTDALNRLDGRLEHYKEHFYLYDLADPDTLVWEWEKPPKPSSSTR
jgi:hypothetical protein